MAFDEVESLVREQSVGSLAVVNSHRIRLGQAITKPQRIYLIFRTVSEGRRKDVILDAWLVGQEDIADGYKLVMRDDGRQFGLASVGFPDDRHLVLVGWYGSLLAAFLAM